MNIEMYDVETYHEMFCYVGYNIVTKERVVFEISKRKNELFEMVFHLTRKEVEYFCGYNILSFDSQVLQYIIDEHQSWVDDPWDEVVRKISVFASRRIDDANYDIFPPYMEHTLWCKQIDLFKIHHFDNKAKRVSLKWLEFSLDLDNIEEMPVPFNKKDLTDEEIDLTIHYCINDVDATFNFYLLTIGDTDNELYKGKNKIQDRLDIIEEFKFPHTCINWSDVKIGDEINLKGYMDRTRKDRQQVYEAKRARKATPAITFGKCIPSYVEFTTKEFQQFHKNIARERLLLREGDDEQSYSFTFGGTTYTIAKGGIHSNEKKRKIIPSENEILKDADVGSQYPNAIFKRQLYPSHLGRAWNDNFGSNIQRRLEYKAKGKKDKRYKGLGEMMKLALNGGGFGKTNEPNSWQYDPQVQFACTIGNQFEILMLIEKLETSGIHVVSANTDGIVSLYDKRLDSVYMECCRWWEEKVGNTEMGKLEYAEYEWLVQTSVNSYIALKKDEPDPKERVKKKGMIFLTEHEINKNKSRRIIPIALEKYFVEDIPVEDTIRAYENIFDFCIGVKSSKDYHFQLVDGEDDKQNYYSVVRYIPTLDGGVLFKRKRDGSEATGAPVSHAEAPDGDGKLIKVRVVNHLPSRNVKDYNIDYDYFIKKANEIIAGIENPKAKKNKIIDKNQLSLF